MFIKFVILCWLLPVLFFKIQKLDFKPMFKKIASAPRAKDIWNHRFVVSEIVHSHPGNFLGFSREDLTTMEAVETALGTAITWSVVTQHDLLSRHGGKGLDVIRKDAPWWLPLIRVLSYNDLLRESRPVGVESKSENAMALCISTVGSDQNY